MLQQQLLQLVSMSPQQQQLLVLPLPMTMFKRSSSQHLAQEQRSRVWLEVVPITLPPPFETPEHGSSADGKGSMSPSASYVDRMPLMFYLLLLFKTSGLPSMPLAITIQAYRRQQV